MYAILASSLGWTGMIDDSLALFLNSCPLGRWRRFWFYYSPHRRLLHAISFSWSIFLVRLWFSLGVPLQTTDNQKRGSLDSRASRLPCCWEEALVFIGEAVPDRQMCSCSEALVNDSTRKKPARTAQSGPAVTFRMPGSCRPNARAPLCRREHELDAFAALEQLKGKLPVRQWQPVTDKRPGPDKAGTQKGQRFAPRA